MKKSKSITSSKTENAMNTVDKMREFFNFNGGNSGLTEDFIYNNQPSTEDEKIPIFSGATLEKNLMGCISKNARPDDNKLKIFHAPIILIIRKGKAGNMIYLDNGDFTINDDVYVLTPKIEWKNKINLRWFVYQYQELFYNLVTSKSDNATFNKTYAEKQKISIPAISEQLIQVNKKIQSEILKNQISDFIVFLREIINDTVLELNDGENTTLNKCFNFNGGNSGLTEDFIYNNQPSTENEKIPILSSATLDSNLMGYLSRNAKPKNKKLKIFNGECILIARNGYAGTMTHLNNVEFTINDHAYVLTPKIEWKNKINLRWFVYQYQELFYNIISSKSDNATFNKTYAEKQTIIIPDKDFQDRVAEKLLKIDCLIEELEKTNEQIEKLLFCEIII